MIDTAVVPHTGVSNGTASVTSDNTHLLLLFLRLHSAMHLLLLLPLTLHLTQQLHGIKSQFADVFAEPSGLPPERGIEHVIPLEPDAHPPFNRKYCLSPSELIQVKRQVTELLQKQLIEPSVCPYGAPLLFVLKRGGELRMVIDYRALNKLTQKNVSLYLRLMLPQIDDSFDTLQGSQYLLALMLPLAFIRSCCRSQTDQRQPSDLHLATTNSWYCPLALSMPLPHSKLS